MSEGENEEVDEVFEPLTQVDKNVLQNLPQEEEELTLNAGKIII